MSESDGSRDINDLNRESAGYGESKVKNLGYDPSTVESVLLTDGRTVTLDKVRAGDHIRLVNTYPKVETEDVFTPELDD